jgi:hypothetical protein
MNRFYIAHRGNTKGANPDRENSPDYIQQALSEGFDVEIDVWVVDGEIFLGHDNGKYPIELEYLKNPKLWCHAKNFAALELMYVHKNDIHFFSHDTDTHVLTSKGYIWTFPGETTSKNTVIVMPEKLKLNENQYRESAGFCSDYIYYIKKRLESKKRIAMLISGSIRCFETCLKPQLDKFYHENSDTYIDIIASINSDLTDEIEHFRKTIFPVYLFAKPYKTQDKYINFDHIRPEYQNCRYLLGNIMSHFNNNLLALSLLENHMLSCPDLEYEYIILYRTDIQSESLPTVDFEIMPETIYYPKQNTFHVDWINMAILLGDMKTLKYYCSLYELIDQYIYDEKICFHPEILATHHLKTQKISCHQFSFSYNLHNDRHKS